jgi:hypothetical protein
MKGLRFQVIAVVAIALLTLLPFRYFQTANTDPNLVGVAQYLSDKPTTGVETTNGGITPCSISSGGGVKKMLNETPRKNLGQVSAR